MNLKESLSEYGLCPSDWCVKKEHGVIYKIENIEQPDFYFKGVVQRENGFEKWKSIVLAGI